MQTSTAAAAKYKPIFYGAADDSVELFWATAVREYTACNLTNCLDRMAAIWGIAKLVRDQMRLQSKGEEYGVGLWTSNLLVQLAWKVVDYTKARREEALESYPSWSWASLMGEVETADRYAYLDEDTYFRATNHGGGDIFFEVTTHQGDNFLPKLKHNEIAIKGHLIKAAIQGLKIKDELSARHDRLQTTLATVAQNFELFPDTRDWVEERRDCSLLVLAARRSGRNNNQERSYDADLIDGTGLILWESRSHKTDRLSYQRIGSFCFRGIKKDIFDGLGDGVQREFWIC